MSQIIACKNDHGILLAADGKAIDFDITGKPKERRIDHLFELTPHTGILTGGAAEGERMCRNLKGFISEEGIDEIDDIYNAALPFLAAEYERYMRKSCEVLPLDPIHHVYFILGGYTHKGSADPYRLYLLWTKKKMPQLDGEDIATAFSVPRIMSLEIKLNALCKDNAPLDELLPVVKNGMEQQARAHEEVEGPFSYALITQEGFRTAE
jgi:hypothetical protein